MIVWTKIPPEINGKNEDAFLNDPVHLQQLKLCKRSLSKQDLQRIAPFEQLVVFLVLYVSAAILFHPHKQSFNNGWSLDVSDNMLKRKVPSDTNKTQPVCGA